MATRNVPAKTVHICDRCAHEEEVEGALADLGGFGRPPEGWGLLQLDKLMSMQAVSLEGDPNYLVICPRCVATAERVMLKFGAGEDFGLAGDEVTEVVTLEEVQDG